MCSGKCLARVLAQTLVPILLFWGRAGAAELPGRFLCGQPATPIGAVQGNARVSPLAGQDVDIEGIVTASFQGPDGLGGFFVQQGTDEQDADPDTSEGIFVHTKKQAAPGERVRVRGTVAEFKGLTELHPVRKLKICSAGNTLPAATPLTLPFVSPEFPEALENMRIVLPQVLTITSVYNLGPFGELVVSSKRQASPTQGLTPGKSLAARFKASERDRLVVDDGRNRRDQPVALNGQDDASAFSAANPIRTGQEISGLEGVLHYGFGHYRLQPTAPFTIDESGNPRTAAPDPVGGTLKVASFNVLNYFSTTTSEGPVCGPKHHQACRGASTPGEKERQRLKLVAAMSAIGADVFGLIEVENNPRQSLQELVDGLNLASGKTAYAWVDSGALGGDAIKVGLLYRTATVIPFGKPAVLDHTVDSRYDDRFNRPALAQTFRAGPGGEMFTVVVTHLKSKGCKGADGPASGTNADQGDGQACFNVARTNAARALAAWALGDPTGTHTGEDANAVLVIGDMNSYRKEDPIRALRKAGLIDLMDQPELVRKNGGDAYTFVYDGFTGTLDYAFANRLLAASVTGITVWHINADEPAVLEYTESPGKPASYLDPGPYRSSDHDPVIVGFTPPGPP